jgi:hypothetical protein
MGKPFQSASPDSSAPYELDYFQTVAVLENGRFVVAFRDYFQVALHRNQARVDFQRFEKIQQGHWTDRSLFSVNDNFHLLLREFAFGFDRMIQGQKKGREAASRTNDVPSSALPSAGIIRIRFKGSSVPLKRTLSQDSPSENFALSKLSSGESTVYGTQHPAR